MRTPRWVLVFLAAVSAVLLAAALLRSLGVIGPPNSSTAQPVGRDELEIAWIHAATNSATWERFVAGVREVAESWPGLRADTLHAFPEQANRVPEITLHFADRPLRLRLRWYKLTSEMGIPHWVRQLADRDPAPLAVIGGGSSDRARDLALALRNQAAWKGSPPLLLITTATADRVPLESESPADPFPESIELTQVYPERTFRFCFQNSQMAEAVIDFIWNQPDLRPATDPARQGSPAPVFSAAWDDDPYSVDLEIHFQTALAQPRRRPTMVMRYPIPYSVGDIDEPNRPEAELVEKLSRDISQAPQQRRLLVLPTLVQPARRILRKLAITTPAAVRNVVAVTGDSVNFNNIYRDRKVAWNGQEIPVPLVFFCHQDPVKWAHADEKALPWLSLSATDDVLLNAVLMRQILEALPSPQPGATEAFAAALRRQGFFASDGNRLGGREEFVVCLRPQRRGEAVLQAATVEVWRSDGPKAEGLRWQLHRSFVIRYDRRGPEGDANDAAP